jgi:hypothetical protein
MFPCTLRISRFVALLGTGAGLKQMYFQREGLNCASMQVTCLGIALRHASSLKVMILCRFPGIDVVLQRSQAQLDAEEILRNERSCRWSGSLSAGSLLMLQCSWVLYAQTAPCRPVWRTDT